MNVINNVVRALVALIRFGNFTMRWSLRILAGSFAGMILAAMYCPWIVPICVFLFLITGVVFLTQWPLLTIALGIASADARRWFFAVAGILLTIAAYFLLFFWMLDNPMDPKMLLLLACVALAYWLLRPSGQNHRVLRGVLLVVIGVITLILLFGGRDKATKNARVVGNATANAATSTYGKAKGYLANVSLPKFAGTDTPSYQVVRVLCTSDGNPLPPYDIDPNKESFVVEMPSGCGSGLLRFPESWGRDGWCEQPDPLNPPENWTIAYQPILPNGTAGPWYGPYKANDVVSFPNLTMTYRLQGRGRVMFRRGGVSC